MALIGRGGVPPVLAQVEDLRADADPVEVSAQLLGYVGLAASRQADHRDHMRLVHEIRTFTCEANKNLKYKKTNRDVRKINLRKLIISEIINLLNH